MDLTSAEKAHYDRHLILDEIGLEGQLKLKQAKVLVIGAGGLGCPILQYLSAAGVGHIGIVDDDTVNVSNLQRQILFTSEDIGLPKAECAAKRLGLINLNIQITTYLERVNKQNALTLLNDYDIIVDGTDNFPTRYLVNDACVILGKPLVFGSIFKFQGQVSVFNHEDGPTYRCLYPTPPAPNEVPNCSEIGVLGVLPGMIGSIQANETLKLILGIGDVLSGKLLTLDALSMKQHILAFKKITSSNIKSLQPNYEEFCGLNSILNEITIQDFLANTSFYNVLDVRTDRERSESHIESIHIPLDQLEERVSELPKDKALLVYCKSGVRSSQAIQILQDLNFEKDLFNLKNGFSELN